MKLINKSIYVLSLAGMLGLWSCTADEEMAGMENSGKQIPVTITVSRAAMPDTRTVLTEDGNGNLTDVWSETDQLALVDATGEQVGTLEFQEYVSEDNKSTAVFEGTMTATGEGTKPYRIWYLGAGESPYSKFELGKIQSNDGNTWNVVTDLATQSGNFGDLVKGDLMHASVELDIQGKKAYAAKSVTMEKLLAMAHFSLQGATNGKLTITNGGFTPYKVYHYAKDADYVGEKKIREGITIANVTGEDVYVVLPVTKQPLTYTFTLNSGNDTWTYTTEGTNTLEAGKYYCNADGTGIGIVLEKEQEEEVVDHSKNPLLKWAETNLVHNENSYISSFAESYLTSGSLYEWGRNHGFTDYNDARGTLIQSGRYGYYYWEYAVTTDAPTYGLELHAGTGLHRLSGQWAQESFLVYETAQDIRDFPKMYMMNANIYGENNGDYWVFADGGDDWYERAEACGYSETNPCPEGWRLPTEEDFKEIAPNTNLSGFTSLKDVINNHVELKTTKSGVRYAIRWLNSENALTIEALVVDKDFQESSLSIIDWKNENVVSRIFPYTGKISGYIGSKYLNVDGGGWEYMARPMPLGFFVTDVVSLSTYYETVYMATMMVKKNISSSYGGYWMADQKKAFKFVDNAISVESVQESCLVIENTDAHDGLAIRCVKK